METTRSSGLTEFVAREILQEYPQGSAPMPPGKGQRSTEFFSEASEPGNGWFRKDSRHVLP